MSRLSGRRLLITRSPDDAEDWAETLAAEGADPILFPCIRTEIIANPALAARLLEAVAGADWLICTSRRGVEALLELGIDCIPDSVQIAAVGATTGARLREAFGRVDLIGRGTGAMLGQDLADSGSLQAGARCVLALAANAGDALAQSLREAGASVERYDVYRTVPAAPVKPKRPLSDLGCDTVLFASPSAVAGFDNQVNVDLGAQIVTIGPSTSAAVRERHWPVAAEAREPSLSGIIDCLLEKHRV